MLKTRLLKLHFGILLFLVLHFLFSLATALYIDPAIVFWPKLIAFLSGIFLFFISWKNRSKLKYYFGVYVFSPLIVLIGWLIDGILGAVLASVFFLFLQKPEHVISNGPFQVKTAYAGFLSACCHYNLTERRFLVLEKHLKDFRAEASPEEIEKLEIRENRHAIITFRNYEGGQDTTQVQWN